MDEIKHVVAFSGGICSWAAARGEGGGMSIEILRNEFAKLNDKLRVVMLAPVEAEDALEEYNSLQLANEQYQSQLRYERNNSESLTSENAKLRELLRQIEWEGEHYDGDSYRAGCVVCGGAMADGHKPNCDLAAALRPADGAEGKKPTTREQYGF